MKKILVIGQFPPPQHGSNVIAQLTYDTLILLGYDVCFIDKKFSKTIDQIGKITISKLFRYPILSIEILITAIRLKPSICIYFIAVGKPAFLLDSFFLFLLRMCKIPYVLRFDGKGYYLLQEDGYFWKRLVNETLSKATGGIVLGNKLKKDVNSNIKNTRLIQVPNCIPEPTRHGLHPSDDKIRVLFLSNLLPTKGVMEVIKAAEIVLKKKEIYFTLAGSFGSEAFKREIERYIHTNNIEKFINLPGPVEGKIKEQLLETSDIFVFPTYYERETFGIVNVEAMSYGLPVITSDEGAIPEIINDGISGYIVNPKSPEEISQKILILADNPFLRKRMGDKGIEIFKKKFTLKNHTESLDRALKKFFDFIKEDRKKTKDSKIIHRF